MPDVVIIGGGIIGLSCAMAIRQAGLSVTVLERGQVGEGASGAAAGMLAPLAEATQPGAFVELGLASMRLYPQFTAQLKEAAGFDVECANPGMIRVALSDKESQWLQDASEWQNRAGLPVQHLTAKQASLLEPELSQTIVSAVLSPEEKQYDPRLLVKALAIACASKGVTIQEFSPVIGFEQSGNRVCCVNTPASQMVCDQIIVAGGAWSQQIASMLGSALPIRPVKGQILALRQMPPPIRHTIYSHHGYLVPRGEGRIIVGATAEEAGFDTRPTVAGIRSLCDSATLLVPALADAPFDSVWAGLRPAAPDGLPVLGHLPGWQNVHVATGHFRNGILLAPITGEIIRDSILGKTHPLQAAFSAERLQ